MQIDFSRVIKIIPTYNEKENIGTLVRVLLGLYPSASVLVVDDNSPDGTGDEVRTVQKEFTNLYLLQRVLGPKGFGVSYVDGLKKVLMDDRYDFIVMMDADFSHDPKVIGDMLSKLADCDAVNGSRYIKGGGIENWKWYRRLLSRFANFYVRTILGVNLSDMTTGFVCLRKEILKSIDFDQISSDGYAFLVELKYRLFMAGARFCEHPIIYKERREGQSKMSSGVIWESIWLPWKLKFKI